MVTERQKVISARNQTGEIAQRIIEGLREAASGVVEERAARISSAIKRPFSYWHRQIQRLVPNLPAQRPPEH